MSLVSLVRDMVTGTTVSFGIGAFTITEQKTRHRRCGTCKGTYACAGTEYGYCPRCGRRVTKVDGIPLVTQETMNVLARLEAS